MEVLLEVGLILETVEDFLTFAQEQFENRDLYFGHGTDNAWDDAVMLVMHVLDLPAENDDSVLKRKLTDEQKTKLLSLSTKRVEEKIPVPYLTGEAWFAGEKYYVNEDVLIPRSPFAELIFNKFKPWLVDEKPKRILDMCTGSGCIAIYCAKTFSDAKVDGVDISSKALVVANKNKKLHNCGNVNFIESDLFNNVSENKYDIIVSNPPYVGELEMQELPEEYNHEPKLALESGKDGLELTKKLMKESVNYLTDDGLLIVEVGNSWHTLEEQYPKIPFTWLEFENGGDGVFLLTMDVLKEIKL